ncbi:MAG: prephenate dehydrogenase [Anaerolineae bacterium]
MKSLSESTITVVGLGLMGGSLAAALRGHCREVIGIDCDEQTLEVALDRGFVDRVTTNTEAGVKTADITVLATPVRTIIQLVGEIGPWMPDGAVLMDVGSTKAKVLEAMETLPDHVQPLGGHPMCGKEISGITAAEPDLFRERTFILSPLERTAEETLALGKELALTVGATPLVIDGERQDYLVGTISHLPYLLACALIGTADATTSADPVVWQIVAGGFRDTSRVAGSDVSMMLDILMTNREEIVKAARQCRSQLTYLTTLIEEGKEDQLHQTLTRIRETRKEMYR